MHGKSSMAAVGVELSEYYYSLQYVHKKQKIPLFEEQDPYVMVKHNLLGQSNIFPDSAILVNWLTEV